MSRISTIKLCLFKSISRRLWMILLISGAVGVGEFLLNVALQPGLILELLTVVLVSAGIAQSSYKRHRHEWSYASPTTGDARSVKLGG